MLTMTVTVQFKYFHYSDPDFDNIDEILYRLEEYNKQPGDSVLNINLTCECGAGNYRPVTRLKSVYESDGSSGSESDDEG